MFWFLSTQDQHSYNDSFALQTTTNRKNRPLEKLLDFNDNEILFFF